VTAVLNVVLLSLAGLSFLGAASFVLKALGARSSVNRQAYSVGQVEAKRASQVNWIRALFLFLAGLIFLGIFAVRPLIMGRAATPEPTPAIPVVDPNPTLPSATLPPMPATPTTPLSTSPPATPPAEPTTAPTPTTAITTATVSSGVGVWLRGSPSTSGQQLEWLLDGTVVTLLSGQETADGLLWQQVVMETGVEGWVARDFLAINEPAP
jgi:hypothetical protein